MTNSLHAHGDVELMARVAAKDAAAQRELIARVGPRVRRIAALLCRSAADADDAAQLSMIEVLRSAEGFRIATSLERWAERIAVRTTLRSARRERERRSLLERWLPDSAQPWGGPVAQAGAERLGLDAVLQRLSRERAQAFVLHHGLEYTVEEIAELTGAPVGTVKDRLVSARKQLREMLRREALRTGRGGER